MGVYSTILRTTLTALRLQSMFSMGRWTKPGRRCGLPSASPMCSTACKGGWGIRRTWTLWKLPHRLLASWRLMPSSHGETVSARRHAEVCGSWLFHWWASEGQALRMLPMQGIRLYTSKYTPHGGIVWGAIPPESYTLDMSALTYSGGMQRAAAWNAQTASPCRLSDGTDAFVDVRCSSPLLAVWAPGPRTL